MAALVDAATRKRVLKVIFVSLLLDLVSRVIPSNTSSYVKSGRPARM